MFCHYLGPICFAMALLANSWAVSAKPANAPPPIVCPAEAGKQEKLAAREIRRYVYCRTGHVPAIVAEMPAEGDAIVVARKDRPIVASLADAAGAAADLAKLGPQQYRLLAVKQGPRRVAMVVGGDEVGVLYGAYRFAEHLGVRFFLHGDVVPDTPMAWKLPDLDETARPLFAIRGVNPWGSHPFGFDAWNTDDYKSVIAQLAKMRMNFIGMHCYPEGHPYAEPTVWHGLAGDFDANGAVRESYPASFYNTLFRTAWGGLAPGPTSRFHYGASMLFDRDDWAPDVMVGQCPRPTTPAGSNEVFNRTAAMFRDAFGFARMVGVKTCIGTEAPLTMPKALAARLKAEGIDPASPAARRAVYEATFRRIMAVHPLDYYWIWTPEGWTWRANTPQQFQAVLDDIHIAREALKATDAPFRLATSGWVLGPKEDRASFDANLPKDIPLSALSRNVGHEPVDPAFGRVTGREKWAIPWLEDDNALASPQLWVGRGRKDAADALAYGCTGLLGLQWRTRILGPNASALAQAGWDQKPWNPQPDKITAGTVTAATAKAKPSSPSGTAQPRTPTVKGLPRGMSTGDFYADWSLAMFGPEAAGPIAAIFERMDGDLPRAGSRDCPAGLQTDQRPWDAVAPEYAFVDELGACRDKLRGAGNIERFDYWLGTMRYLRATARLQCSLGVLANAQAALKGEKDPAACKSRAAATLLPAYREVVARYGYAYRELLGTVSTKGALATVIFWEQSFLPNVIAKAGKQVSDALGEPLPADLSLATAYRGRARLIVPTARTHAAVGEKLAIRAIVLAENPPREVALHWRKMGDDVSFIRVAMTHVARGVYAAELPAEATRDDIEYCILVDVGEPDPLLWPPTAPGLIHTVVILP